MAKGSKKNYSNKQKRMAEYIEEGYEKDGVSHKKSQAIAWATVNKKTGGAKKKKTSKK